MNIPRSERGNLLAYFENVRQNAKRDAREKIYRAELRYMRNGGGSAYNRQNLNILQATSKPISIVVKKRRYDDLWEDFMEYLDADAIYNDEDLKEQLDDALSRNERFDDWRRKKPGSYKNMVNRLANSFIATGRTQEFLIEKNVEQLSKERATLFKEKARNKEKFDKLVGQKNLWRVYNDQKKETSLVYKSGKTWRELNTGRFGTNPEKRIKQLMRKL